MDVVKSETSGNILLLQLRFCYFNQIKDIVCIYTGFFKRMVKV